MKQSILDTDTLSYIADERYPEVTATARQYFRVFRYFSVTAITIAEVVEGLARSGNHSSVDAFLKRAEGFEVLPIDFEEAVLAGRILAALRHAGIMIGGQDPFIAAAAITNGRALVTNNTSHYQRIIDVAFHSNWTTGAPTKTTSRIDPSAAFPAVPWRSQARCW